jgi:exopolysaccharide production protein ExoQ
MPPGLAALLFAIGIAGLFFLDRGEKYRVSKALWIPTAWLFLISSRSISQWLGLSAASLDKATLYAEGNPVDRAVFLFIEILALVVVLNRLGRANAILRRNYGIGLFFSYAALSILWSEFPLVTLKHWIKGIGDVMMVLIVLTEPSVIDAMNRLVTRIGFVHLPLSILFIKYYPWLGRRLTNSWTLEAVGVSTQKNGLGQLCAIFGLGLLWRFRSVYIDRGKPNRRRHLLALGTALGMVVWLLWHCNSITSICSLSMAGAVMLLSTRPLFRRRPSLVHLMIVAVPAIAIYALFFQSSGALVEGLGRNPTLTGRTEIWALVLSIPNQRLIGAGYESFWMGSHLEELWLALPNLQINEAHNGYIEIFINLGWIGVALLGLLIATGYRNVLRAYRRDFDTGSFRIAFFLATIVTGFTEAAFRMMGGPWIVFLLATADAPWMPRRRISAVVTSTQGLPEPVEESDAVRKGAPAGYRRTFANAPSGVDA